MLLLKPEDSRIRSRKSGFNLNKKSKLLKSQKNKPMLQLREFHKKKLKPYPNMRQSWLSKRLTKHTYLPKRKKMTTLSKFWLWQYQ